MLTSALVFVFGTFASVNATVIGEGSHCVAYQAEKVIFFVSSSKVVGMNCDISAQVLPDVGGLFNIEVNVPVRSFTSGDTERDKDVMKLLQAEERAEITFRSKAMKVEEWKELFAQKSFKLPGEIVIGKKTFPLTVDAQYEDKTGFAEVRGLAKVKMQDFDISPPRVAGGIVVKAKPDLELYFNLVSSRILGADSIRLKEEASL